MSLVIIVSLWFCMHMAIQHIELCVTSWQNQTVSWSQNAREKITASREYIWLTLVKWSVPNAPDKIKGADVVVSINHVFFLTNGFIDVHHLCFGNKWISILFSRIFLHHGHFENMGVYILQIRYRSSADREYPYLLSVDMSSNSSIKTLLHRSQIH